MLAEGTELQPVPYFGRAHAPAIPSQVPQRDCLIDPYPIQAVDFLLSAGLPGRLWNSGNVSGYLIWRLAPEHDLLFTDNRYDIYGGLVIRQEHAVLNGWTEAWLRDHGLTRVMGFYPWNEVLDRWGVQTVFIPTDAEGNRALLVSGAWERVYEDYQINLWVRRTAGNESAIRRAQSLPRPTPWRTLLR